MRRGTCNNAYRMIGIDYSDPLTRTLIELHATSVSRCRFEKLAGATMLRRRWPD